MAQTQSTPCCKVCIQAGQLDKAHTHTTRGEELPEVEKILREGSTAWPLIKEIGRSTQCPILMATVCTNPLCFNGKEGMVRYPMFGHSRSHCPCEWPIGWEQSGPNSHLRKSGIYNKPSQFATAKMNNQKKKFQGNSIPLTEFNLADFIKTQELLESGNYPYEGKNTPPSEASTEVISTEETVEYTWNAEGKLGIKLKQIGWERGVPNGVMVSGVTNPNLSQDIKEGMVLVEVDGVNIENCSFNDVLAKVKAGGRPITLKFKTETMSDDHLSLTRSLASLDVRDEQEYKHQNKKRKHHQFGIGEITDGFEKCDVGDDFEVIEENTTIERIHTWFDDDGNTIRREVSVIN